MKKIGILLVLLFLTLILIGQSAQLNYNKVEVINGGDTILLDNEGLITFTKGTLIMQNTDKRINTFLVPGSEFDKLGVAVFDDTEDLNPPFTDVPLYCGWPQFIDWVAGDSNYKFAATIGNPHAKVLRELS